MKYITNLLLMDSYRLVCNVFFETMSRVSHQAVKVGTLCLHSDTGIR